MKKVIKISISFFIIIVFIVAVLGYHKLKIEGATEAAHVFMSPVSNKIFNDFFSPYPSENEYHCSSLFDKVTDYQKIELLESSYKGVYIFKVSNYQNDFIILTLHDNGDNTWGVSCSEE